MKIELKLCEIGGLAVHGLVKLPGRSRAGIFKQAEIILHASVRGAILVKA